MNMVMLAHSSQPLLTLQHRSYKGMVGQEAELGMMGGCGGWAGGVGKQGPLRETLRRYRKV